jgi:hypothetical protein
MIVCHEFEKKNRFSQHSQSGMEDDLFVNSNIFQPSQHIKKIKKLRDAKKRSDNCLHKKMP